MSSSQFAEGMEPDGIEHGLKNAAGTSSCPLRSNMGNAIAVAALALLILLFFFKTSFSGASISRLCVLAEWDSVFDAWRTGKAQAYDPSLVQIFCPDYVFLAKNLSKGILPLWNPHCGLGYPFVADIQSSVFAPLRFVFDFFPNLRTYNYYLLFELLASAVSTFFLTRALRIGILASLFAAVTYTFCPYNLWYMEMNLGASFCLFPLCALAFVKTAQQRTIGSAILAGLASAILIMSGHPECSFFGILLSSALMFLLLIFNGAQDTDQSGADPSSAKRATFIQGSLSSAKLLLIAAIVTVAISAPALFPFGEYLMNGESYKYGSTYSTPVTWNGIFFNLFNPGQNGASPYLGIIAAALAPLSLFARRKDNATRDDVKSILILTGLTFLLVSQFGPVQAIFSKPPFTAIITRYALPYLLLLVTVLASIGLQELAQRCKSKDLEWLAMLATFFVMQLIGLYVAANVSHDSSFMKAADFDAMLPPTALNSAALKRDAICSIIFTLIAAAASAIKFAKEKEWGRAAIILIAALAIGFISEGSVAKLSLPTQSKFFYPETELIDKLKDNQYRTISTVEYIFRPATNAVYGVNFLTVHNPLFPKRFLEFSKACGAKTDVFNQTFDTTLSPLLNLASVKYILSLQPLTDPSNKTSDRFKLFFKSKNNISVYENIDAAPRAYLVNKAVSSSGPEDSLLKIQSNDFTPQSTVVIESKESTATSESKTTKQTTVPSSASEPAARYTAVDKFETPDSNTVSIACDSPTTSWLVLTDIYYPGWNVYIDGKKSEILRANYAFRSVKLEAGKHNVVFKYEPFSFTIGLGLLACVALLASWSLKSGFSNYKL